MKIDFNRLNHVLIPKTKEERDRWRSSRFGRLASRIGGLWWSLTEEGRMLAILTFVVGAFAIDVRGTSAYVLFSLLCGIVFGSLIASRGLRIPHVVVSVNAPRRVTVGEEVSFTVTAKKRVTEERLIPPLRVRGPFLPWDGTWVDPSPREATPNESGCVRVTMKARFAARGLHHLDPFTASAVVPLGLACGPRRATDAVKVHVVPRIANVTRLPPVIATRHQPGGVALASKSGESMDLHGVRPYRPGDPVRDLHARTWARTGVPVVREYQQEYFTRVGVVLDTDVEDPERLEAAIELAAGVIAFLSRGEALVDVLVVGDRIHELVLGRSLGYLDQALELLATVERGPKLRATELLRRLDPHLALLSTVFVINASLDEERSILERSIKGRGAACTSITVDDALVEAIKKREALAW
jgi:uncharacterized protein (DUF58 family)